MRQAIPKGLLTALIRSCLHRQGKWAPVSWNGATRTTIICEQYVTPHLNDQKRKVVLLFHR